MSHALLSPSGASRWLECTPSARLEEQFPDSTSEAAKEGTLAHRLGETILRNFYMMITPDQYFAAMAEIEADPMYNVEMQSHAENYAAFVIERFNEARARTKGEAELQIEAKIDLTRYVPEGFGTGDAIIIADGTLEIIDLKYGKGVSVSCENNKQMMLYALGAVEDFELAFEIHDVAMTIYQPRLDNVSTFVMPVGDLLVWGENELKPRAELAFEGKGEFMAGKHCQFCRAKAQCRELARRNLEIAKYEFRSAPLLNDEEIADVLRRADEFSKWISAVEEFAFNEAVEKGKKWPGFKLVEGRSNRVYTDQDKVAGALKENGYPEALIYEPKKLLGITAMEKAITKKSFTDLLSDFVAKPQGKPTLVPESDKRPEWNSAASAIEDFK